MENKEHEEIVQAIFKQHHDSYMQQNVEVIKSLSGVGQQVMADYEGRVIFELLQNAFDKAESKILVLVQYGHLYVANDGQKFSYMRGYDYNGASEKRGDFQSICSFSNSTKDPSVSIGNKGVGFKSVFAMSSTGYVDLFTQGSVIDATADPNKEGFAQPIAFRIYDVYDDNSSVPNELGEELCEHIKTKIAHVQAERRDRGVPGYFFPVLLQEQDSTVTNLFSEGYVTIVRIPLDESGHDVVKGLLKEMQAVHFRFVGLRVKRAILVSFRFEEASIIFDRNELENQSRKNLVSYDLKDKLLHLAKAANLKVTSPVVAIYFHGEDFAGGGRLFNYLPTLESSPFKHADFHADFQTSVNRRNIVFNNSSAVGKYNQALFEACVELYFVTLYSALSIAEPPPIHFRWIDFGRVKMKRSLQFRWRYLDLSNSTTHGSKTVKEVIGFKLWYFARVAELIARMTNNYFSIPRQRKAHVEFFSVLERFITDTNARELQWEKWDSQFYHALSDSLVEQSARIIPSETTGELGIVPGKDLFLRNKGNDDRNVMVPSFVGITVSTFAELPYRFRSAFGAKEFNSRQDIFKHYRQATANGEVNQESITDEEQKMLLRSVASFLRKDFAAVNQFLLCTHRYDGYIKRDVDQNSDANQANFAISTLFLKTKEGLYKPAQLCSFEEVHPDFLPPEWSQDMKKAMLLYLGVSPHENFRFVEGNIYSKLKDGITFIPRPIRQLDGSTVPLYHSSTVDQVRVVHKGQSFHPAEINEAYPFLKRFEESVIRSELASMLVKDYPLWPKEYTNHLYGQFAEYLRLATKADLMRLYRHTYLILHEHLKVYLIAQNGTLSFSESYDFRVAANRDDFDVIDGFDTRLLALTNVEHLPHWAANKVAEFKEGKPEFDRREADPLHLMVIIKEKLPFLALAISHSPNSKINYVENHDRLKLLQQKIHETTIWVAENLSQRLELEGEPVFFNKKRDFAFDKRTQELYIQKGSREKVIAEAIAKYILDIRSLASAFELILFHKDSKVLRADYGEEEVRLILRAMTENFDEKLRQFEQRLADRCEVGVERFKGHWNIHRPGQESELLCELAERGKLETLEKEMKLVNREQDGLFQHLQLQIDKGINLHRISDLIARLQQSSNSDVRQFIDRLKRLNQIPHLTATLEKLEGEIKEAFPSIFESETLTENSPAINAQLRRTNNLQEKWDRITSEPPLEQTEVPTTTTVAVFPSSQKVPKGISTSTRSPREDAIIHEKTGREGEERLLGDFIVTLTALPTDEIRIAIDKMEAALRKRFKENWPSSIEYLTELVKNCYDSIDNHEALRLELLDLMHISARFPFAPFDLIHYENGKVKFVEVKTTKTEPIGPKDSFELPSAELLEAIYEPDFLIVRVTPTKKTPLGNPFFGKMDFPSDIDLGVMLLKADRFIVEYELR